MSSGARDRTLRIGMLTPLSVGPLRDLLDDPDGLPPGIGGPGPTDLIGALVRAGHHVTAISLDPTIQQIVRRTGPGLDLRMVPMRPGRRGRDAYRPERAAMREELATLDVDLVHAQWTYEYGLVAHHAERPYMVTVRDWAPLVVRYNPIPYWIVKLGMNVAVLGRRPHLSTPSPSVRARLQKLGFRDIRLIPNGLAVRSLAVDGPRVQPEGPPVLLSVTNEFSGRKNTDTLMRAFAIIRRRHPGARLLLIGSEHGPGEAAQEWARAQGLEEGLEFLGMKARSEVLAAMSEATMLVHPAREEPFGIVVIEAMSQGLPVVGGRQAGGVPFILDEGRAGEVVDVDDPEAIAAGVLRLLQDPAHYGDMSARGLRRVRERFDIDQIAKDYVQAYTDLLDGAW